MNPNFQELLVKYLKHLHVVEETLFLEFIGTPFSNVVFTPEEKIILHEMEQQIRKN